MTALFALIGIAGIAGGGYPARFSPAQLDALNWTEYDESEISRTGICFMTSSRGGLDTLAAECRPEGARVLLWGDSHAAALSYGLARMAPILQITSPNCAPLMPSQDKAGGACALSNRRAAEALETRQLDLIVLQGNWAAMQERGLVAEQLTTTLAEIVDLQPSAKIVLAGGVPQWHPALPIHISRSQAALPERLPDVGLTHEVLNADAMLAEAASGVATADFLSLTDALCGQGTCQVTVPSAGSDTESIGAWAPVIWDYGHLTGAGALYVARGAFADLLPLREHITRH